MDTDINYTDEYISRQCNKLEDAGLLQRVDASNYRITDLGVRFLDGELDAADLQLDSADSDGSY